MADSPKSHYPTVVIGGGQAGLSASVCLSKHAIEHVVLERKRVASSWRDQRWDNFCLVTPNWQCTLPDYDYTGAFAGDDPDGFMKRDQIVDYIERFRQDLSIPVLEGIGVQHMSASEDGFQLRLSTGLTVRCDNVIVATGGYHTPRIPAAGQRVSPDIVQLHSSQYKNAAGLPEGSVLVVGTGQSGCQIAEDLHLEGRQVHLAVGKAPRSPRFYRGRDVTAWLVDMGAYAVTVDEHPMGKQVRKKTNHYLTGRDGGREIDLRRMAMEGMQLYGRLQDVGDGELRFADDLGENLNNADASAARIKAEIDKFIVDQDLNAPPGDTYQPPWQPSAPATSLPLDAITSIVWCTGFHKDYRWIDIDAFDEEGEPSYQRGVSTYPGLYFLGLPWMHTWGSGRFSGVADDARHVVDHLAERSVGSSLQTTNVMS
ncbi:MAG: MSMEG_0569 family flavin-dependent oxidoreductase [Planctomycetota bacterium]